MSFPILTQGLIESHGCFFAVSSTRWLSCSQNLDAHGTQPASDRISLVAVRPVA
jgi:hypothetical protein